MAQIIFLGNAYSWVMPRTVLAAMRPHLLENERSLDEVLAIVAIPPEQVLNHSDGAIIMLPYEYRKYSYSH